MGCGFKVGGIILRRGREQGLLHGANLEPQSLAWAAEGLMKFAEQLEKPKKNLENLLPVEQNHTVKRK